MAPRGRCAACIAPTLRPASSSASRSFSEGVVRSSHGRLIRAMPRRLGEQLKNRRVVGRDNLGPPFN
jgi:hypothetical protein